MEHVYERMRRAPDAWRGKLRWWSDLGIDKTVLLRTLHAAIVERSGRKMRLTQKIDYQSIHRAKRALRQAAPLIGFLKTEYLAGGPPDLLIGEEIERVVQRHIDRLAHRERRPLGRRADPRLEKLISRLLQLLRALGQSRKRSWREIHELLVLAGYEKSEVTREKIRHIDRKLGRIRPQPDPLLMKMLLTPPARRSRRR